jgi:hypothetical protein
MAHRKTRRVAVAVRAIALSGVRAFSQQSSPAPPARTLEINAILDAWVQQSSRIRTLSAKFS